MKTIYTFILGAVFMFCASGVYSQARSEAQKAQMELKQRGEIYFSFVADTRQEVIEASRYISVDHVDELERITVLAYANQKQFDAFVKLDLPFKLEAHPGSIVKNPKMMDVGQLKSTKSWNAYPTYSAYVAMMYQFETDYPDLCEIVSIGQSVSGRELLYAKISDNVDSLEAEPRVNYTSTMHGDETVGFVLMLRLIDYLLSNYGTDVQVTNMVQNMEIWINPNANPDGTYMGGNTTVSGAIRYNANYVDLNRNWKDFMDGDHPDGYAWQTETVAFMDFADSIEFVLGSNLHGGAEVLNYPWDTQPDLHADDLWWQHVCREYADSAQFYSPSGYLTQLNNGITNGYAWYTTNGSRQDYMNYYKNCREVTLELSSTKNPAASTLPGFWDYNYRSLLRFLEQAQFGVNGIVSDSITGEPLKAKVYIAGHDSLNTHVFSKLPHGDYYRPTKAGTYSITYSAPGYTPKTISVTVTDNAATVLDVQLGAAPPAVAFSAEVTTSCTGKIQFIDQTNTSSNSTYTWSFGDGTTSAEMNPLHQYTQDGVYDVSLTVTNSIGTNTATQNAFVSIDMADVPIAVGDTACGNQSLTLSASGSGTLQWFADSIGGTVIDTGNVFTTAVLSANTVYYVSDSVAAPALLAAKPDNSGGGGYFTNNSVHYLVFDCYAPTTLKTVKVYANSSADRIILLRNSAGDLLDMRTVYVAAGEQTITLDFELPVANDLQLVGPPSPDLYRNNDGLTYPYELPGSVSVKYSSASSNPTGYYYYFYDWVLQGDACMSPRVQVPALISNGLPTAGFTYTQNGNTLSFTNTSSNALDYEWDFGDGNVSNETSPNHQFQSSGSYSISLNANNGCGADSHQATVTITVTVAENVEQLSRFKVFPNPAENIFFVEISEPAETASKLCLSDILGNTLLEFGEEELKTSKVELDVSHLPNGVYFIRFTADDFSLTQKVLLQR